jgi:hypothetical protein
MSNYYAFVNGKLIAVRTKMVDARSVILNNIFGTMRKGKVCADPKGKKVLEHMRCVSSDIRIGGRCPIQARKEGTDKWRDVTADGTIC